MSVTYITYRLRRVDDKHWKASVDGPYNIAERTPKPEIPHFCGYWGYVITTDLDPNNAGKHLRLLADKIIDSIKEEVGDLRAQAHRLEAQCKDCEKEFEDMDKLVETMTDEGELWDD